MLKLSQCMRLMMALSLLLAGVQSGSAQTLQPAATLASAPAQPWVWVCSGVDDPENEESKLKIATFGNGCFWCTEAVFKEVKGVVSVTSGYTGGKVANPSYRLVCTGTTGHAEALQIEFDPEVISYEELLEVFWKTHDPTTRNRQGADVGTQYRSAIFVHDEEQRQIATELMKKLDEAEIWNRPIVTTIEEAAVFYPAEDYHQDYYELNPNAGYCQAVIVPKLEKFREVFRDKLKEEE